MLPNFMIGGVQKGGTTWMYRTLKRHPQIFLSELKELDFFWRESLYAKGLDWYAEHFQDAGGAKAMGEVTPTYLYSEAAPERIAKALPGVKLIFSLRNPVDRAYSAYRHNRRRLAESLPFEEAIRQEGIGYIPRGFYYQQLKRYHQYFPKENILILIYEEFSKDPVAGFKQCFQFLGVDDSFVCSEMTTGFTGSAVPRNKAYMFFLENPRFTSYLPPWLRLTTRGRGIVMKLIRRGETVPYKYPPMDQDTRAKLVEVFREPNRQLAQLLGRNLTYWDN